MESVSFIQSVIRKSIGVVWTQSKIDESDQVQGPINTSIPGFRVARVSPSEPGEPWHYLSMGASATTTINQFEFLIVSPHESSLHVETLAMVANYHADPRFRLDLGTTVNIGRPWIEGSDADHLLLSLPYLHGPSLENCLAPALKARILWLVPIQASEAAFVRQSGWQALEELFDLFEVDVISPARGPVVDT